MILRINDNTVAYLDEPGAEPLAAMEEITDGKTVRVKLSGNIGNVVAGSVYDELCALLSVGRLVQLDLDGVHYLSSSMVDFLITLQSRLEKQKSTLPIVNVPAGVYQNLVRDGFAYTLDLSAKEG